MTGAGWRSGALVSHETAAAGNPEKRSRSLTLSLSSTPRLSVCSGRSIPPFPTWNSNFHSCGACPDPPPTCPSTSTSVLLTLPRHSRRRRRRSSTEWPARNGGPPIASTAPAISSSTAACVNSWTRTTKPTRTSRTLEAPHSLGSCTGAGSRLIFVVSSFPRVAPCVLVFLSVFSMTLSSPPIQLANSSTNSSGMRATTLV